MRRFEEAAVAMAFLQVHALDCRERKAFSLERLCERDWLYVSEVQTEGVWSQRGAKGQVRGVLFRYLCLAVGSWRLRKSLPAVGRAMFVSYAGM